MKEAQSLHFFKLSIKSVDKIDNSSRLCKTFMLFVMYNYFLLYICCISAFIGQLHELISFQAVNKLYAIKHFGYKLPSGKK